LEPIWKCRYCGFESDLWSKYYWCCPRCSKPLDIIYKRKFEPETRVRGLRRYSSLLPFVPEKSLGEGNTPLINYRDGGREILFKLEYLNPSGSFKDRGSSLAIYYGFKMGYRGIVEDTSGNTGLSVTLYSSFYGLKSIIYMPRNAPLGKKVLIKALGGEIVEASSRYEASRIVLENIRDRFYVAHTWSYFYILGASTIAYEVYEEYGVPDLVIAPVGSGGLFLGLIRGFKNLYDLGVTRKIPRFIAVQGVSVHPLFKRMKGYSLEGDSSLADGIMVSNPPRLEEIYEELVSVKGDVVLVDNKDIINAMKDLYERGFIVEPTSATVWAGYKKIRRENLGESVLMPLTGSGLKTIDLIEKYLMAHGP